jgi:hypothetical protein
MSFEGDTSANRGRLEGQVGQEADDNRLAQYPGLEESLFRYCDSYADMTGEMPAGSKPLGNPMLLRLLAYDENARAAVRSFLSRGGRGYERDSEIAEGLREELAWELVEYFAQQKR